jgi:hypothetical protein
MKKLICLLLLVTVAFTGCKNVGNKDAEHTSKPNTVTEQTDKEIYWMKYSVSERLRQMPDPEDLPEGYFEYDDEGTFRVHNDKSKVSKTHFPVELYFKNIDAIYEGDVSGEMYEAAVEWLAVLYEAERGGNAGRMANNIRYRYPLLTQKVQDYAEKSFIQEHTGAMYSYYDTKYCALRYVNGDNCKFSFEGYKTTYTDFTGEEYYGITAMMQFDMSKYQNDEKVPEYITSNDMAVTFYVEVIFDQNGKIAGWCERYNKKSDIESNSYYIVSPDGIHNGYVKTYFSVTLDESVGQGERIIGFKYKQQMFDFVSELILTLKNNSSFSEKTFERLREKCDIRLLNSYGMQEFFEGFLTDIKKYNVDFEFDPFTLESLNDWSKTSVIHHSESKYGELYCIGFAGHIKTGSEEFNDKYGLRGDREAFDFDFYFTVDDGVMRLIGIVLDNYNYENFFDEMHSEALDMIWRGEKIPYEDDNG